MLTSVAIVVAFCRIQLNRYFVSGRPDSYFEVDPDRRHVDV